MSKQVNLHFECSPAGETFLARRFVTYPFFFTAPFRLDRVPAGMLTAILQSVSGGIYNREQLALSFTAGQNAHVHCTTQSATVVHSMANGEEASQLVTIHAARGSFVEYLPDALILFPEACLRTTLHVVIEEGATVILSDAFLTHDPKAQGRSFRSLSSETVVQNVNGQRLCIDRFVITGEELRLASVGYCAQGTMWILNVQQSGDLLPALRKRLEPVLGIYAGVSTLPHNAGVWVRILAIDGVALHKGLHAAWAAARSVLTGEEPQSRRKTGWT
ncbi:MAG: hypothetical protein FJ147_24470 [Deltaproteobacteria bacterium]|nr:hypothetical protein [Deltaproteobacteria bacterium]